MNKCLNCSREFPDKVKGDVEPGGMMLCLGCGFVMAWTDDLTLRELTHDEYVEAGTNYALMRERAKIMPRRSVQSPGSWVMTCLFCLIVVMVVLERIGIVPLLHHK